MILNIIIFVLIAVLIGTTGYLLYKDKSQNSKQTELETELQSVRDQIKVTESSLNNNLNSKILSVNSEISSKQDLINKKQDEFTLAQLKNLEAGLSNAINRNKIIESEIANTSKLVQYQDINLKNYQIANKDEHNKFQDAINSTTKITDKLSTNLTKLETTNKDDHNKFQTDIATATKSTGDLAADLNNFQNKNTKDHNKFQNDIAARVEMDRFLTDLATINRTLDERKKQMDEIQNLLKSGSTAQTQVSQLNPELKEINDLMILTIQAEQQNDVAKRDNARKKLYDAIRGLFMKKWNDPNIPQNIKNSIPGMDDKLRQLIFIGKTFSINEFDFLYSK